MKPSLPDLSEVHCPGCGCEQLHLEACRRTEWNGDFAPADSDDATWLPMRGHALILSGECENGCEVEIAFGQHKGTTYLVSRTRTLWQSHPVGVRT